MKRLAIGAAAAGSAAFALHHHLAPKAREMHAHCREMMHTHCGGAGTSWPPEETPRCA